MNPVNLNAILKCHPGFPADCVRGIEARVELAPSGTLAICYRVTGEIQKLRMPPAGPLRRGENLWQHTCFELFVSTVKPGYYELNFSPSGEWAVYRFLAYRKRTEVDVGVVPGISIRSQRSADTFDLDASIDLSAIYEFRPEESLRLGVSVVVADERGALSYWAPNHPTTQPDFHHPESFVLQLPPFGSSVRAVAAK